MKYCITMSLMKILENNQLVLRISIEMAAFSIENSTKNAAISIETRCIGFYMQPHAVSRGCLEIKLRGGVNCVLTGQLELHL